MKKRLIKGTIAISFLICIYFFNTPKENPVHYFALENIEALAQGEGENIRCYGTGSVDCRGFKVEKVYSGFNLH